MPKRSDWRQDLDMFGKNIGGLVYFLNQIPKHDEDLLSIREMLNIVGKDDDEDTVKTLFIIFGLFNFLEVETADNIFDYKVRCLNKNAEFFRRSLVRYFEINKPMVLSWEYLKLQSDLNLGNTFAHGQKFVFNIEQNRIKNLRDKTPLRKNNVVQLIIKARVKGLDEPAFLMQFDKKAERFQHIGGKIEHRDKSSKITIERKLKEELNLSENCKFTIKSALKGISFNTISLTYGIYTEYKFEYFEINFSKKISPSRLDRWITLGEIIEGYTNDGIRVADFSEFGKDIKAVVKKLLRKTKLSSKFEYTQIDNSFLLNKIKQKNTKSKIIKLLNDGESEKVEFKSSIAWDYKQNKFNRSLENPIIKTISAFMNSNGGSIIIGVNDSGDLLGLEKDIKRMSRGNEDRLLQHIVNVVSDRIGVRMSAKVHGRVEEIKGKKVLFLQIDSSPTPVFYKNKEIKEFYIRSGVTTRLLDSSETYDYIRIHWGD